MVVRCSELMGEAATEDLRVGRIWRIGVGAVGQGMSTLRHILTETGRGVAGTKHRRDAEQRCEDESKTK